ncbi:LysR family transcriptional regulator [Acetomicrobium sp.]|uniref:LysR family transcriptional regulator n=1 Tax=Acetomicrobium sp. TaxID=1872099 RepID=UPI00287211BF|nr:LysR family transcriptional regulator [Acetomicrobium sp.]MDI9377871.1 LysR family transcriptional regulator [Synergistota bacterium]MDR9769072.1 LysR family transcriptional regulator [Acetomicrobium sp.]
MTLQQLRTFLTVCDEMSITGAASRLFITQSAVSQQIKALEEEFEIKLFDKKGRRICITSDGKVFFEIAKNIIEKADSITEKLKATKSLEVGSLNLASTHHLAQYLLMKPLIEFHKRHSKIDLTLQSLDAHEIRSAVEARAVDIGFVPDGTSVLSPFLNITRIYEDRMALIAWPEHPWRKKDKINPSQLEGMPFVFASTPSSINDIAVAFLKRHRINVETFIDLGNIDLLKEAVRHRVGLALTSKLAIQEDILRGSLVELPLAGVDELSFNFLMLTHKYEEPSYASWAFQKILKSHLTKTKEERKWEIHS